MKKLLSLILLVSIVLESTLIPFPLTLLMVALVMDILEDEAELIAFVAGIALDIFTMRILGADSIYFLLVIFVARRYRLKLYLQRFWFRLLYLTVALTVYEVIFYRYIDIVKILLGIILASVLLLMIERVFPRYYDRGKLSV